MKNSFVLSTMIIILFLAITLTTASAAPGVTLNEGDVQLYVERNGIKVKVSMDEPVVLNETVIIKFAADIKKGYCKKVSDKAVKEGSTPGCSADLGIEWFKNTNWVGSHGIMTEKSGQQTLSTSRKVEWEGTWTIKIWDTTKAPDAQEILDVNTPYTDGSILLHSIKFVVIK